MNGLKMFVFKIRRVLPEKWITKNCKKKAGQSIIAKKS